ncbi:hypothetical protein H0X06_00305 [Candidatus Dependentiae bacterium]|nr:hypothetical protein [Candidatus Dependentiae bacterium]
MRPDDPFFDTPMIVVCNDTWSSVSYVQRLMFLATRFKALHWQRDIVYAGYQYAAFCGKDGQLVTNIHHKTKTK